MRNKLGFKLNEVMNKLSAMSKGFYKLNKDDKDLINELQIIEKLIGWQELSNVGITVNCMFGNYTLEIYDYTQRQNEIDATIENFYL